MQNMRKASQVALAPTLLALKAFVKLRILPEVQGDAQNQSLLRTWLEKTVVAFVLFATSASSESESGLESEIKDLLDTVQEQSNASFSAPATHAAQALIWKAIDSHGGRSLTCFYETLRHPLFDNASQLNKGRIGR
jgi:hypothetical protein